MADYLPLFTPGQVFTRTASADVLGGQLVRVSGSGTVAATSAASDDWLGVAAFDAKTGELVTVWTEGIQRLKATGAVAAGALVAGATAGTVATGGTGTQVVGLALTAAAGGQLVEVKFTR